MNAGTIAKVSTNTNVRPEALALLDLGHSSSILKVIFLQVVPPPLLSSDGTSREGIEVGKVREVVARTNLVVLPVFPFFWSSPFPKCGL